LLPVSRRAGYSRPDGTRNDCLPARGTIFAAGGEGRGERDGHAAAGAPLNLLYARFVRYAG